MNKVLFCYDGPISKDEKGNYYGSALNDSVLSKYHYFGDKVSVAIRVKSIKEEEAFKTLSKISNEYDIIELPNVKTVKGLLFNKKCFNKIINDSIKKSDFVIIRMPSIVGNLAIKYCEKYNKKYIVEMVGCTWDSLWNYGFKGKIVAPYSYFITKSAIKNASNVIYVTEKFLQSRYPNNKNNIGISDVFLNSNNKKILDARTDKIKKIKENDKIILGTCAALNVKYKGQEYVIKAIKELKDKGYNNFEYQLVGGGSRDRLKKIAVKNNVDDCINFIGSIPHDRVFKWLENVDIYIQPSNQEGLSRAVVEAMSMGCPCIVSDTGGNPELIDRDYIFNKKNVLQLSDLILRMNNNEMINQSKRNYRRALDFSYELLEKKRINFYDQVLKKSINK